MKDELRDTINTILDVYEIEGIDATSDINMIVGLCKDMAIEAYKRYCNDNRKTVDFQAIKAINKAFE